MCPTIDSTMALTLPTSPSTTHPRSQSRYLAARETGIPQGDSPEGDALKASAFKAAKLLPTPTSSPPRVVLIYLRVSKGLKDENYTFETQLKRILEKLNLVYGEGNYTYVVIQDDGLSGGLGPKPTRRQPRSRKSLREITARLESGEFNSLAVYHSDRLFRSPRHFYDFLEDVLLETGADFISASENTDITTVEGRMAAGMMAVFNGSYRERCSQRGKDSAADRSEEGYHLGPAPYGWINAPRTEEAGDAGATATEERAGQQTADDGTNEGEQAASEQITAIAPPAAARVRRGIARNEEQGVHLLWMKERFLEGWGTQRIAGDLNKRGVPSSQGVLWSSHTVLSALLNTLHAGCVQSKRRGLIQGQHYELRYWDLTELQEMQRIKKARDKHSRTNTGRSSSPHLVAGFVDCARCGKRLYPAKGGKPSERFKAGREPLRYYRCRNGEAHSMMTCRDITLRAERLEDAIVRAVEQLAATPHMVQLLKQEAERATGVEQGRLSSELTKLRRQQATAEERLKRLLDGWSRDLISDEELAFGKGNLMQEQSAASARISEIETALSQREHHEMWVRKVKATALDFPRCWSHLEVVEKRQVLSTLIERCTIERQGRDMLVRLKLHLLPEQQIAISTEYVRQLPDLSGVDKLTPRQLEFLHWHSQGHSYSEIAREMGINSNNAADHAHHIRERLSLAEWAKEQPGFDELPMRAQRKRELDEGYRQAKERIGALMALGRTIGSPHSRGAKEARGENTIVLTPQQQQMLLHFSNHYSNTEVAQMMGLPENTVVLERRRIRQAFRTSKMSQIVQQARALGLL